MASRSRRGGGGVGSSFSNLIWKSSVCPHFKPEIARLVGGIRPTDWRDFAVGVYYYYLLSSLLLPRDRGRKIACAGRETDNHARSAFICGQTTDGDGGCGGHARLTGRNRLETFADVLPAWTR